MISARSDHHLAERFGLSAAPTLQARVLPSVAPIAFTRMRHRQPHRGRSTSPLPEEAFSFQLPLVAAGLSDLHYAAGPSVSQEVKEPGRAFLFDLSARPTVGLTTAFDNVRIYIAQTTIDALALERGLPAVGGLGQPHLGARDPILFHLALALVPALDDLKPVSRAYVEHVGLAVHAHVIQTYGGVSLPDRQRGGRLASWQVQRVRDRVEADLAFDLSISDLAGVAGLSTSYFNDAFKATMGMPPHRWVLKRRVERAKALLAETDLSLAEVAVRCGFYDQGHLSRVFGRSEGCTPNAWRRHHRSG